MTFYRCCGNRMRIGFLESTVDRISLESHELAGRAKDLGSAAVFLALANLVIVWALVLMDLFAR